MEEIWKKIVHYPKYYISNLGRVRSHKRCPIGRIMCLSPDQDGYLLVELSGTTKKVHRLVAEHFVPKIEGKDFVDHIDGNKQNNRDDNVRWCTSRENTHFHYTQNGHTSCVSYCKSRGKWRVRTNIGGRDTCISTFETKEEGVEAYQYFLEHGIKAARNKYLKKRY